MIRRDSSRLVTVSTLVLVFVIAALRYAAADITYSGAIPGAVKSYATPSALAASPLGGRGAGAVANVVGGGQWVYQSTCPTACDGSIACVYTAGGDGGIGSAGCWASVLPNVNGFLAQPDLMHVVFGTPGVGASLFGTNGEVVNFSRASSETCIVGGVELVAGTNHPCVDEEGLHIEPAATNWVTSSDFSSASFWTALNAPQPTPGATDPAGGTSAYTLLESTGTGLHGVLTTALDAGAGIPNGIASFSVEVKANGRSIVSLGDNGRVHTGVFDLTNVTATAAGAGAEASIEPLGSGWYRVSISYTSVQAINGALVSILTCATAATCATTAGDVTMGIFLRRPQAESNPFATVWIAAGTSRAADVATVWLPNFGSAYSVEIVATPLGSQRWDLGGALRPLYSLGTYQSAGSLLGYTNAGKAVASVYDSAGTELHTTSATLASGYGVLGVTYMGPRTLAFSSGPSIYHPSVLIEGQETISTTSGSGSGLWSGGNTGLPLRIGATSSGIVGGFRVREVRVTADPAPAWRPSGAFYPVFGTFRGYVPPAHVVDAIGDSITEYQITPAWASSHAYTYASDVFTTALYEIADGGAGTSAGSSGGPTGTGAGITDGTATWNYVAPAPTPYPQVAAAILGTTWVAHNFGVGSRTTAQVLDGWLRYGVGRSYAKVVVEAGINDLNGQFSSTGTCDVATVEKNLLAIYQSILANGGRVYPITILPSGNATVNACVTQVNAWISQWAVQNEVLGVVIDAASALTNGGSPARIAAQYDLDGSSLHPNQSGETIIGGLEAVALVN